MSKDAAARERLLAEAGNSPRSTPIGSPVSRTSVTTGVGAFGGNTRSTASPHASNTKQELKPRVETSVASFDAVHTSAPESRSADFFPSEGRAPFSAPHFQAAPSAMPLSGTPSQRGYADLCRLARFGANLADAHSCFIFFHASVIAALDPSLVGPEGVPDTMVLAGFHSLCPEVIPHSQVSRGNGLVGWVAKHARSIHVSPFELDSRTLGIYSSDQQLKSFIGIPIRLDDTYGMLASSGAEQEHLTGVLACDSKKSFAFSKLQGKLLEDLAREVSSTVGLLVEQQGRAHPDVAWHSFLRRASELSRSVGIQSLEITRIVPTNFHELERTSGTSAALTAVEQVYRIVQQILPPHFPCVRLANGDIVIALDNMMISFYESRIRAVSAHHLSRSGSASVEALQFEFVKAGGRDKRRKTATVEELVQLTSMEPAELRSSLAQARGSSAGSAAGSMGGAVGTSSQAGAGANTSSAVLRLEREVGYGYRRA